MDNTNMFNELRKASKPLVEFLNEYYNPNTKVIVSDSIVEVVSGEMTISTRVEVE